MAAPSFSTELGPPAIIHLARLPPAHGGDHAGYWEPSSLTSGETLESYLHASLDGSVLVLVKVPVAVI